MADQGELFRGCGLAPCAMAANLGAHLDPRENGADNARIISAMDPPHDRRRAPPLPPRTTPFSGRTRRVGALLHSSEIVTERLRPLRRQGKPTFRSDPPCKQKQTTPEDFQQLPMAIKYLPKQREHSPRSESGLPGWMRSVTQCGRPSGGRKPPFNNTDQTYATNHDELHSRDDDDFDDTSSVSTTVSSEMNTDLLDTSLEACSFGSFAVGSRDTLGRRASELTIS